jgi:hypothetical protein
MRFYLAHEGAFESVRRPLFGDCGAGVGGQIPGSFAYLWLYRTFLHSAISERDLSPLFFGYEDQVGSLSFFAILT